LNDRHARDLFVSSSRVDEEFVQKLVDALAARGKDVWPDREDIRKGADWREKVYAGGRRVDNARADGGRARPIRTRLSEFQPELAGERLFV
jgi:TIR domain